MNRLSHTGRAPRRPSRLGLALTFALLIGLLVWRHVMPGSPFWVDLSALACAGGLLFIVRTTVRAAGVHGTKHPPRE